MSELNGSVDGGARSRLVTLLREIAQLAGERSLRRCPYRDARDVCTFRGECGNRFRSPAGGRALCTGGPLNARPASAEEVAAALEQVRTHQHRHGIDDVETE